jgi:hypothetical protein
MSAHLVSVCVVCQSQTDAFLCGDARKKTGCLGELLRELNRVGALMAQLSIVRSGRAKTAGPSVGFISSGGGAQPLPVNEDAANAMFWLRDRLCSWARLLWEDNAPREADGSVPPIDLRPDVVQVALWLLRHPTWIALSLAADEMYREILDDLRAAWSIANRCSPKRYFVGRCRAVLNDVECLESLFVQEGAFSVRCPVCGAEHEDLQDRWEEMAGCAEDQYVPIGDLVGLVDERGARVSKSTIRNLYARGRFIAWVAIPDGGEGYGVEDSYGNRVRVRVLPEDEKLVTLYRLGDVLDAITNRYKRLVAA